MSQYDLSDATGISILDIPEIEADTRRPKAEQLERFADYVGVDPHVMTWCLNATAEFQPAAAELVRLMADRVRRLAAENKLSPPARAELLKQMASGGSKNAQ